MDGELFRKCHAFVSDMYTTKQLMDPQELTAGLNIIVIANVRGEYIRMGEIEEIALAETTFDGIKVYNVETSIPDVPEYPYHILFRYGYHNGDSGELINGKVDGADQIRITDDMMRNRQVFSVGRFPKEFYDVARKYYEQIY